MVEHLQAIAARIDTGTSDSDTSRALIVFNLTDHPLNGVGVFHVDMSLPTDIPLPPVMVANMDGEGVPSAITDFGEAPDRKGRAERRQITFSLRFAVQDVPPKGWRTYIASYTSEAIAHAPETLMDETPNLIVIETLRHEGDLPPVSQGVLPRLAPVTDGLRGVFGRRG